MWDRLHRLHDQVKSRRFETLFQDPQRAETFSVRADGLLFDYAKTNIDHDVRHALLELAHTQGWDAKRDAMFAGEKINITENRAVLHTALRRTGGAIYVDGHDVMPDVIATRDRMVQFADDVRRGQYRGAGGKITDVVNIGIGGSDLGPVMAVQALMPYADGPRCHFVSNIDGAHISDVLAGLDPATTLIIVASKTFTTIETMTNARTARDWMARHVDDPAAQFAALSSATDKTADFGIDPSRVFGFEDWVGGRYSMWGPIGLPIAMAIGGDMFHAFLAGARAMDVHFQTAAGPDNMPLMLALVGLWHAQICGYDTRAVLPYEQRLLRLPAYLQQLEMESNGKGVTTDGAPITFGSGPIVWGEPGTNGQHAFYQLIHQGTRVVPCEFMVGATSHETDLRHHHRLLQANCLAQSEALMTGRSMDDARAIAAAKGFTGDALEQQAVHRVFAGNRPSTTLCYPKLTPYVLGQIVALYEHRVFVEGVILGINSFDQWGVELGKDLATKLGPVLDGAQPMADKDGSTQQL
ncbi:MAG: glucose-6-phosphate isomerase, partial [Pseudomonadota bacterium]